MITKTVFNWILKPFQFQQNIALKQPSSPILASVSSSSFDQFEQYQNNSFINQLVLSNSGVFRKRSYSSQRDQRNSNQDRQEGSDFGEKQKNNKNQEEQSQYRESSQTYNNLNGAALFGLPFLLIMSQKLSKVQCYFSKFQRNQLKNRISTLQYQANNPIEDRVSCAQLSNIDGFFAAVYDGHGGWQISDYCEKNMVSIFESNLSKNKNKFTNIDELVIESLTNSFDTVEDTFLKIAREGYEIGFPKLSRVGSCALTAVITDNKLFTANIGDCKGYIIYQEENNSNKSSAEGIYKCRKVNHKLNASSKKEQERLKNLFSKEPDIIVCRKGSSKACYVKNRLQPTRAFGDFTLKYKEFNNPKNLGQEMEYRPQLHNFTGPYITHKPDIKTFNLQANDKFLILASDGLWDELTKVDVAQIVQSNLNNKSLISQKIFQAAIEHAAKEQNLTLDEIKSLSYGQKRKYHDDISIVLVDLENQVKN